jgi:hypothetical protein
VNPEIAYMERTSPLNRYDNILMLKYPKKSGVGYPPGADYILDGYNLKGVDERAFVRFLISTNPK